MTRLTLRAVLLTGLAFVGSCQQRLDGAPCPCVDGWVCCAAENACRHGASECRKDSSTTGGFAGQGFAGQGGVALGVGGNGYAAASPLGGSQSDAGGSSAAGGLSHGGQLGGGVSAVGGGLSGASPLGGHSGNGIGGRSSGGTFAAGGASTKGGAGQGGKSATGGIQSTGGAALGGTSGFGGLVGVGGVRTGGMSGVAGVAGQGASGPGGTCGVGGTTATAGAAGSTSCDDGNVCTKNDHLENCVCVGDPITGTPDSPNTKICWCIGGLEAACPNGVDCQGIKGDDGGCHYGCYVPYPPSSSVKTCE